MSEYYIAEINIARMLGPIDSDIMHGFTSRIEEINTLAENSEGFVWRLIDSALEDEHYEHFPEDNMLIFTFSMWESIDDLHNFVYRSEHGTLFKQRNSWFSKIDRHHMVLWYVPKGTIPTIDQAKAKLAHLDEHGETAHAFTFVKRFSVDDYLAESR